MSHDSSSLRRSSRSIGGSPPDPDRMSSSPSSVSSREASTSSVIERSGDGGPSPPPAPFRALALAAVSCRTAVPWVEAPELPVVVRLPLVTTVNTSSSSSSSSSAASPVSASAFSPWPPPLPPLPPPLPPPLSPPPLLPSPPSPPSSFSSAFSVKTLIAHSTFSSSTITPISFSRSVFLACARSALSLAASALRVAFSSLKSHARSVTMVTLVLKACEFAVSYAWNTISSLAQ
mmetsp:Transcript_9684/g.24812  ORF Transcript_9684/g.24812 Transcript_9684/m.24812 type:complete len:233 (+) Transcript_9684:1639-2337(+)